MSTDGAREYVRRNIGMSVGTIGDRLEAAYLAGASRPFTEEDVEAAADAVAALKSHPMYGGSSAEEIARAALDAVTAHRAKGDRT